MRYSIVDYQFVLDSSHSMRIDAEFFHPDYLKIQHQLEEIGSHKLIDFQVKIRHPIEIKRNYVDDGVLLLRGQNVRPLSIDLTSNPVYISEADAERLKENTIRYKNILIMRSGANVGQCAIYLENSDAISMSDTLIIQSGNLNPFFLTIFLNTKYGTKLIERGKYGSAQPHIAPPFLYQIPIPVWNALPSVIENSYLQSKDLTELSKTRYIEAQTLLLSELGLTDWQPKQQLTFVKNFSDMEDAARIDADYFQPKYDDIVNAIKGYSGGWDTLESLCELVGHPSNPPYSDLESEDKTFIVAQKHLGDYMLKDGYWLGDDAKYTTADFVKKNTQYLLKKNDLVLYTVGGPPHIGKANIIFDKNIKATIGSFVTLVRVDENKINPFSLLVLFNSRIGYLFTNRFQRGMVQQYVYPKDLIQTVIPILPQEKQIEIQEKVLESFRLRKHAKDLLEHAKSAVEIAIEQDEQAAIDWLESVM